MPLAPPPPPVVYQCLRPSPGLKEQSFPPPRRLFPIFPGAVSKTMVPHAVCSEASTPSQGLVAPAHVIPNTCPDDVYTPTTPPAAVEGMLYGDVASVSENFHSPKQLKEVQAQSQAGDSLVQPSMAQLLELSPDGLVKDLGPFEDEGGLSSPPTKRRRLYRLVRLDETGQPSRPATDEEVLELKRILAQATGYGAQSGESRMFSPRPSREPTHLAVEVPQELLPVHRHLSYNRAHWHQHQKPGGPCDHCGATGALEATCLIPCAGPSCPR